MKEMNANKDTATGNQHLHTRYHKALAKNRDLIEKKLDEIEHNNMLMDTMKKIELESHLHDD